MRFVLIAKTIYRYVQNNGHKKTVLQIATRFDNLYF